MSEVRSAKEIVRHVRLELERVVRADVWVRACAHPRRKEGRAEMRHTEKDIHGLARELRKAERMMW